MLQKRIVLFYKRLLGAGGAERQLVEDYKFLRANGAAVNVLTFELNRDALLGIDMPEIEVIRWKNSLGGIGGLRRRLRELRPDLISVHSGHIDVYLATRGLAVPYVFHHNSPVALFTVVSADYLFSFLYRRGLRAVLDRDKQGEVYFGGGRSFGVKRRAVVEVMAWLNRAAIRAARDIIVLSEQTVSEIRHLYGRSARVVRGCLDPAILDYKPRRDMKREMGLEGRPVILSVSRLTFEKRLDLLIEAFAGLKAEMPDIALIIGGKGPKGQKLKELARSLGCEVDVHFVGFIEENELWDYYASCDVFAAPAWADFNIAPYEALALGRKVVWSSEMEGEEWVLNSGLVFEARPNVRDLVEALRTALGKETGERIDFSDYTWSRKYERVYGTLLK